MSKKRGMTGRVRTLIYVLMASTTLVCTQPPKGWAMMVPVQASGTAERQSMDRAADMKTVQQALESKIVRERLKSLGLSEKETDARISRLSDKQVHELAKNINTLAPGGFVDVVGILVLVLVVLLIVWLIRAL